MQQEIGDRSGELDTSDPEFWRMVAAIAIEHVSFDLHEQLTSWPQQPPADGQPTMPG